MTEPLTADQRDAIGWPRRQGLGDAGNQFHYYRLTEDDRILWGGYDAIYHWRNGLRDELDQRPATFELLARALLRDVPAARGRPRSRTSGAARSTRAARFSAFWGTAPRAAVAYVGRLHRAWASARRASGRSVMLDLLEGAADRAHRAGDGATRSRCRSRPSRCAARRQPDPLVTRARGRERRPAQRLAADARPRRPRLRLRLPQLAVRLRQLARLVGGVELLQRRRRASR